MTGREFLNLIKIGFPNAEINDGSKKDFTSKKYVYGINGLANLLGCGKTKAQAIKNYGDIDEAIYQTGKKLIIDADKALELLKNR